MILDRVTITGADDSVQPEDLLELSADFPFVEWGILASANYSAVGGARFPSMRWLEQLKELTQSHPLNLSLHLCGRWVRDLLIGDLSAPPLLTDGPWFQRIQLNFHAERVPCNPPAFVTALLSLGRRQFIFQIDGADGNKHLESVYAENGLSPHPVDAVPLFDISGGAGVLPEAWPRPMYLTKELDVRYHGYAGGLGPQNLERQLPLIAEAASGARIWIDMETHVRSTDDRLFDLGRVQRCLEICAPLVSASAVPIR